MASVRDEINKLLREASTLCEEGEWEAALLAYRKGLQMRPHSMACRAGVLRTTFIIRNAIKGLEDKIPINLLNNEDTIQKKEKIVKRTFKIKRTINTNNKTQVEQNKKPFSPSEYKPYSGIYERSEFKELTKDFEFIQKAKDNEYFPKNIGEEHLLQHLSILLKKDKMWRKQDQLICSKNQSSNFDPNEKPKWIYIIKKLETENCAREQLELASKHLEDLKYSDMMENDKMQIEGKLNYIILKAHVDLGDYNNFKKYYERVMEIADTTEDEELDIRSKYLQGRAFALAGNYLNAIRMWQEILSTTTNQERVAHLFHEVGRCYFRLQKMDQARAYGILSLESATQIKNDIWVKNAAILVAQIETLRGYKEEALKNYEIAELAARRLNDQRTLFSIVCETTKLGKKLRRPKIDDRINKMSVTYRKSFCRKTMRAQFARLQSSTTTLRRPKTAPNTHLLFKKA